MIEFFVIQSMRGTFRKLDGEFGWAANLDDATLFSSLEQIRQVYKEPLHSAQIIKYTISVKPNDFVRINKEVIKWT